MELQLQLDPAIKIKKAFKFSSSFKNCDGGFYQDEKCRSNKTSMERIMVLELIAISIQLSQMLSSTSSLSFVPCPTFMEECRPLPTMLLHSSAHFRPLPPTSAHFRLLPPTSAHFRLSSLFRPHFRSHTSFVIV